MLHSRRTFIKQLGLTSAGIALLTGSNYQAFALKGSAGMLPRSAPEVQGVSSNGLLSFLDAIEKSKIEFHSLMVLRHGNVIAEGWWTPYSADQKHTLYSLSKSFTSTATGLAISEGKFSLDSKVISFFPDELPAEVSANLAAMKVRDLLSMETGHAKDTIPAMRGSTTGDSWAKIFLSLPIEYEPGTHFLYNTGATYMCSAIVQKTTGQTVLEYLKPRLFEPLGITGMDWELDPKGIATGGYGLRVKTEDIAKFGQLMLQKGMWNGKQLVPPSWIADATSSHADNAPANPTRPNAENDWAQGYGFQFWRCTHNAVRGDGAFGQFCIMMPDQDMVVAITGESFDLQGSMKLVWDHLLPAVNSQALAKSKDQSTLQSKLKGLALALPTGSSKSISANVSGKTFALDENPFKLKSVAFKLNGDQCDINFTDDKTGLSIRSGLGKWVTTKDYLTQKLFPIAGRPMVTTPLCAAAAWTDENTLMVTLRYTETAHSDNIMFTFAGENVTIKFLNSVAKGNPSSAEPRAAIGGKVV